VRIELERGVVTKIIARAFGRVQRLASVCSGAFLLAAAGVLWGTFFHNGQVCESGTRALVSRKIYDEFVGMLVERAGKIVIGDNTLCVDCIHQLDNIKFENLAVVSVPTLSQWSLAILSCLLALGTVLALRRRRR